MERKPEDGCEIQDSCCGKTGIICRLTVVKGASNVNEKDAADINKPPIELSDTTKEVLRLAGVDAVLELTYPWHGTN